MDVEAFPAPRLVFVNRKQAKLNSAIVNYILIK